MLRFNRQSAVLPASLLAVSMRNFSSYCESNEYDLVVIGGGSGGLACAKRAATYGAKVVVVEGSRYGGTCVNVGCVPKKVMYNTAHVAEVISEAKHFGFNIENVSWDWKTLKKSRDKYISRLNAIYSNGLDSSKVQVYFLCAHTVLLTSSCLQSQVDHVEGFASFSAPGKIKVNDKVISGKHILIAVGGAPNKLGVPGEEYVIDSDGFFALEEQPKKVAIIGAGYIAVELAGVFNGLGTNTSLFVRQKTALRNFDSMIVTALDDSMKKVMNLRMLYYLRKFYLITITSYVCGISQRIILVVCSMYCQILGCSI